MSRAKVLSFINYKGGVAKTTTTYHVGCSLAQHHGKKVLLIDIDPQTNLTFLCATVKEWQAFKKKRGTIATLYKRYMDGLPLETKRFIWQTPISGVPNIDLLPCDIELLGEDIGSGAVGGSYSSLDALRKNSKQFTKDRSFISKLISEVSSSYDYVLIDCPPNLYLMTQNALVASDSYIVTAIPDHLSTIGLQILGRKVEEIGERMKAAQTIAGGNGQPRSAAKFGGVIFVRVRIGGQMMTNMHFGTMQGVRQLVGTDNCFENHTTELIGYGEASEGTVPVWLHPSQNARRAAEKMEYQSITDEFLERF